MLNHPENLFRLFRKSVSDKIMITMRHDTQHNDIQQNSK